MSARKNIYINGRFLLAEATGVQKYALGLCLALQKTRSDIIIIAPRGDYPSHGLKITKKGIGKGFLWEQVWLPLYLKYKNALLLINLCNTAPLFYTKNIVCIHDLAFLREEEWFSNSFIRWYKFLIPRICKKALKVMTVSETIKNEIRASYSIALNKIEIVSNGSPEMVFDEKAPYPYKYFFLTSIYNKRKNAFFVTNLLSKFKEMGFHIVGCGSRSDIYKSSQIQEGDNLHILQYVDDIHYYTLIKHAEALIYPSDYEGFGIPILEALLLGTPVFVPDMPLYRELFGTLPTYYESGDGQSLLESIKRKNNARPSEKDIHILKNKYNFTASASVLSGIINRQIKNY